jgi:heme-degrading monooxygenase HmoA
MVYFVTFEGIQPVSTGPVAEDYFNTLLPHLLQSPGYESFAYYAHETDAKRGMLVATFKDEEAIKAWQSQPAHLDIQKKAREHVYDDYRIRIGHEVNAGDSEYSGDIKAKSAVLLFGRKVTSNEGKITINSTLRELQEGIIDESLYHDEAEGKTILLSGWKSTSAAIKFAKSFHEDGGKAQIFQVTRDYTKFKRDEAPKQ